MQEKLTKELKNKPYNTVDSTKIKIRKLKFLHGIEVRKKLTLSGHCKLQELEAEKAFFTIIFLCMRSSRNYDRCTWGNDLGK